MRRAWRFDCRPTGRPATTRAMVNRASTSTISTAAVAKPRWISAGCGERTNSNTASGRDIIGLLRGFEFVVDVIPETSRTGAVSPTPRATPRITALTRPDLAVGSTTCQTVRHCGAPVASEASRRFPGTSRRTTSADRTMMGSIMMLMAREAAKPDRSNPRMSTQVAKMKRPARIEGSAVIAVTTLRTSPRIRLRVSLRKTAQARPRGTVTTSAIETMMTVPSIACRIPPFSSGSSGPALLMSWT
uniref:Unannotated protein n=1 Tax=freshwater metagenome TaxID=449393 RepID=A0A6J7PZE2_9ZZZZ